MWWVYFAHAHQHSPGLGGSSLFGYFHYVIFAAAGALSARIEVAVDGAGDNAHLTPLVAAATLAVPVALFMLGVW